VFKHLRTSTKLFLLCGMFVGSIILATYSLIEEKQIAIGFVRKELVGAQYLEALRGVYAVILAEDADASQGAQRQVSVDAHWVGSLQLKRTPVAHSIRLDSHMISRSRFAI
jgi:hypothetical protein